MRHRTRWQVPVEVEVAIIGALWILVPIVAILVGYVILCKAAVWYASLFQ